MVQEVLAGLKLLLDLFRGRKPSKPIGIYVSESSYDTYFNISSADRNDYPRGTCRSYLQLKISLTIDTPEDITLHSAQVYLYRHRPESIVELHDTGPMSKSVPEGSELSREISTWVDQNPPLGPILLKAGASTTVQIPKYARVDPNQFHKTTSPFTVCTSLHLSGRFIRLILRVPLSGMGTPRLLPRYQVSTALDVTTIVLFCAQAAEADDALWTNRVDVKEKFRIA